MSYAGADRGKRQEFRGELETIAGRGRGPVGAVDTAMAFVRVADAGALPPGQGLVVTANGREIALFNLDGQFHAIDNECPHASGPLGEGYVEGGIVTCPIHAWEYDIRSGACLTVPEERVPRYAVKVEDGGVWVDSAG